MPTSKQRSTKDSDGQKQLLSVFDVIDRLLSEQLLYFPAKGQVTELEIEKWHQDLKGYSQKAIEWAFDEHRRVGRFFPIYSDINLLLEHWQPPIKEHKRALPSGRRGLQDYWPTLYMVFEKIRRRVKTAQVSGEQYVPMGDEEIEKLFRAAEKRAKWEGAA